MIFTAERTPPGVSETRFLELPNEAVHRLVGVHLREVKIGCRSDNKSKTPITSTEPECLSTSKPVEGNQAHT